MKNITNRGGNNGEREKRCRSKTTNTINRAWRVYLGVWLRLQAKAIWHTSRPRKIQTWNTKNNHSLGTQLGSYPPVKKLGLYYQHVRRHIRGLRPRHQSCLLHKNLIFFGLIFGSLGEKNRLHKRMATINGRHIHLMIIQGVQNSHKYTMFCEEIKWS